MQAYLTAEKLAGVTGWVKATDSGAAGHCVEMAPVGGRIAVRNSNAQNSGGLLFTRSEIAAFVDGAKKGEFDHLT